MDSFFNWEQESKKQWNQHSTYWSKRSQSMWDEGSRKDIIPFVHKYAEPGKKILDVGCGDGYGSYKLQQLGYDVVGIDLSSEMISKAKEKNHHIPFLQGDVNELPFESKVFRSAMVVNVLEWVEIPAKALQELKRVLQKGGYLCVGILGPTAGPRAASYRKVYGEKTINNTMMPWEFAKLAKEMGLTYVDGFGVYKNGVQQLVVDSLSIELKQALSFMWVFMYRKEN